MMHDVTEDLELKAIVSWLRGQSLDDVGLDWERVRRLAFIHGVAPLLQQAWAGKSAGVPATLLDEFKRIRQGNALRGALSVRQRNELVHVLTECGIPCLVLKGAALGQRWYGELSLRPFVDIDLLISRERIPAARAAMSTIGYIDSIAERTDFHEIPIYRPGQPCSVEIHHELTSLPGTHLLTYEALHGRSMQPDPGVPDLATLGPEDTLMHLCLHLLHHLQLTEGWALRYLCDMDRHIRVFPIDWDKFSETAQTAGAWHGCQAVLGLVVLATGAPVPAHMSDEESGALLFGFAVPDQLDTSHHFLAAFLAATARGNLRLSGTLFLRSMVVANASGRRWGAQDLRPGRLFQAIRALMRELVTDPKHLFKQVRAWYTEGDNLVGRERLVAQLFEHNDV